MTEPSSSHLHEPILDIYSQTRSKFDEYSAQSDLIKRYGYWVLCGPPKVSPPFFIISLNPGASAGSMSSMTREDLVPGQWPPKLNYLRRISPFAKKLTQIFDQIPNASLADCCAGYGLFFRSPDAKAWKQEVPTRIRKEAENFSVDATKSIIRAIKPRAILTVGRQPFKAFVTEGRTPEIRTWGSKSIKLIRYGDFEGIPAIGIPHISGARLATKHLNEIARHIAAETAQG